MSHSPQLRASWPLKLYMQDFSQNKEALRITYLTLWQQESTFSAPFSMSFRNVILSKENLNLLQSEKLMPGWCSHHLSGHFDQIMECTVL